MVELIFGSLLALLAIAGLFAKVSTKHDSKLISWLMFAGVWVCKLTFVAGTITTLIFIILLNFYTSYSHVVGHWVDFCDENALEGKVEYTYENEVYIVCSKFAGAYDLEKYTYFWVRVPHCCPSFAKVEWDNPVPNQPKEEPLLILLTPEEEAEKKAESKSAMSKAYIILLFLAVSFALFPIQYWYRKRFILQADEKKWTLTAIIFAVLYVIFITYGLYTTTQY